MLQIKKLYMCQKAIIIKKEHTRKNSLDVNFSLNKNDMLQAMKDLSSVGFALYMYCASNMEEYAFGLSKNDVCNATGMSTRSYNSAVTELIEKKYFIYTQQQATDGSVQAPLYEFHAQPHANFA